MAGGRAGQVEEHAGELRGGSCGEGVWCSCSQQAGPGVLAAAQHGWVGFHQQVLEIQPVQRSGKELARGLVPALC